MFGIGQRERRFALSLDRHVQFPLGKTAKLELPAYLNFWSLMSAPSRRPEIRRRRTRKEKIAKLRKRLGSAANAAQREQIEAKIHRQGLASPGNPLLKKA